MKYTHNESQQSMFDFGILKIAVPADHELVKMSRELDWKAMLEIVGKKYSKKKGRNSKSLRMMIALEIAKRKYGLSDQAIVEQLKVDAALKYFCGFNEWVHEIPEASSLSRFRARLDDEALRQLEEVNVKKMIGKVPKKRRHQVITDSTCVEANITYPTDSKLLSKTYEKLVGAAEEIRRGGAHIVLRGKRKMKQAIRSFNLQRRKSKRMVVKMNKKLIRESKKVMALVQEHLALTRENVSNKMKRVIKTAETIIQQQSIMIKNNVRRAKDRVVSFHETEVRPIFRGKAGKQTEFGPKLAINVIGGALVQTTKKSNDNFSDTEMVPASLGTHKKTFDRAPNELIADRGAHSPQNHQLLKEKQITDGIQYRGKIPKKAELPSAKRRKRMYKQRSTVEGKLGVFKTSYGGNRNRYKNKRAQCWISFGFIAMNATWAAGR